LAFPLLRARRAEAASIRRFITFFVSSGVRQDTYFPTGAAGDFASGSYSVVGKTLDVLTPHLADLIITKGISIYGGFGGDDHDFGAVTLLTGNKVRDFKQTPYALGESLDQYLARTVGSATPEPSMLLGLRLQRDKPSKFLSYDQTGNYKVWNQDPYAVYARLFQGFFGNCTTPNAGATAAKDLLTVRRKSVLDSMLTESAALKRAYGMDAAEVQKLERLETAIRSVERRLEGSVSGTASAATCQTAKATFEPATQVANTDANFPALLKMDIDLAALAVELDVTRVITMMVDMGGLAGPPMTWLSYNGGPLNDAHHPITHGEQRGVSDYLTKLVLTDRYYLSQFGYLLDQLKGIQEGGGTALDNSVAWYASDCSDGKAHSHTDMPFIIAGRGGGELKTGRYVQLAGAPLHQRLLLTFAHLMGDQTLTTWGAPEASAGGPLLL
jgi:hypothetical protein